MVASSHRVLSWTELLDNLRRFSQVELQTNWKIHFGKQPVDQATQHQGWKQWQPATLNDRRHIAWDAGKQALWLGQQFVVPAALGGYDVSQHQIRLDLTWWADSAQIFVNGALVQEGDLFDCVTKFRLAEAAEPGQMFDIAIRLTSPGHDRGALVLSQIRFEAVDLPGQDCPEPGFVADELAVLGQYLKTFQPESLGEFEQALQLLGDGGQPSLLPTLQQVRDRLIHFSPLLKQRQISLLGHAHLDMAWLWPVAETWDAAERTFESALKLQNEFPELTFGHSSPALYAWLQEHRPELWQRVKDAIASNDPGDGHPNNGQWEVIAGPWIEPDCVLPSGESLIRQLLYGQRYVQKELGFNNRVAWLPDSFGFCNQFPQILKQGGVDYFVTEKLLWNDTTEFPHQLFQWRAPDGTAIASYMSARIGTQIAPVQMTEYACNWEKSTGLAESLWLPGVGDHGGGPTREMLETAARWARSPFFPRLEFSKAHDYLDRITGASTTSEDSIPQLEPDEPRFVPTAEPLPVWDQDLYLEYHRGCYTTHADQKRYNRESEALLYQAELFASLATIATGATYPKAQIEALWKTVLFNQFHDILPGTSIPEVFVDANRDWAIVMQKGQEILTGALEAIAHHIQLPEFPAPEAKPLVVFNPLNWSRSDILELEIPADIAERVGSDWNVCNRQGEALTVQRSQRGTLLVAIDSIPSVGYTTLWLAPSDASRRDEPPFVQANTTAMAPGPAPKTTEDCENSALDERGSSPPLHQLENDCLVAEIDPATGDLASIYSKTLDRELLRGPGNQLQAFRDGGDYWDAWNIKPDYEAHPLPPSQLLGIETIEQGPLEWRVRVERGISNSICKQDYVLRRGSDTLYIETEIGWEEDDVLLKAAFPLALEADRATYETPCGTITRTTKPQTEAEKAQWEVPALRWGNLSDNSGEWGVSLINNCKYGYDAKPGQLRLTLLRASNWPEVGCDRGLHRFTYAIHAHAGTVNASQTVERGYELQIPFQTQFITAPKSPEPKRPQPKRPQPKRPQLSPLPDQGVLLSLGSNSLVLSALKPSEDDPQQWIGRCYEAKGQRAKLQLSSDLGLKIGEAVDGLERSQHASVHDRASWQIQAWQIQAFTVLPPDLS